MAMANGRPQEHDRVQLAKDLVAWSELETSLNLNGFCGKYHIVPSKVSQFAREDETFRLAYEEAKANLGERREVLLSQGKLHVKAYDLNACVYDHFLKEERRDEAKFTAAINTIKDDNPQFKEQLDRFMDMIEKASIKPEKP